MVDMIFTCRGRIWLMTPQTDRAKAWMDENLPVGDDGRALGMATHGVVADFVGACSDAGLTIDLR